MTARTIVGLVIVVVGSLGTILLLSRPTHARTERSITKSFQDGTRPILVKYCLECHSTKAKKGTASTLERFNSEDMFARTSRFGRESLNKLKPGRCHPRSTHNPPPTNQATTFLDQELLDAEARAELG